ncbi:aminotransferase class I/II-fold pyridoxal phosphate-dependent enzyme [Micromonospora sp. WMMD1120]|uniref:DegT/DnrJ/EryC1/StrS family aminotransferase n=1 Tax=Micromonospora sp. WMMD1120 TaxID=3016106 RepID=UPI002417416F|nr:aminotransferase class I/II-fold pyridoxal phosphate-dependent enzyme [Micromonospora sp. WMMD1120]MDG4809028.1 aminotransferase class I/II-fold pyridoxal phosphate-dependent enzyme [Micromonospora sp. WMMD1120]
MTSDTIHLSPPDIGPLEEQYATAAIRSGWVAPLGPEVDAFESEMARRVGTAHAVATNSGTAALHLGLLALGAGPERVVVVPTLTFAATANAVVYTGARPFFVDCDPSTGNLDVGLLDETLTRLRRDGRQVAAVIPVDMFGRCADYERILPICAQSGVPVLEDAAEALGSTRAGQAAGSFGRAGVLSFNGNKIITTSGGGMLLTDDAAVADRVRYLATQARRPVSHYEHADIGYNYRLSNILAAIGRAQLRRLDSMIGRRRDMREQYAKMFAAVPGVHLLGEGDQGDNCWLTVIVVDPGEAGWEARDLAGYLADRHIETRPVWMPMHLQPVHIGVEAALTGAAERLFTTGLTLPSGSAMTESQRARVGQAIDDFLTSR